MCFVAGSTQADVITGKAQLQLDAKTREERIMKHGNTNSSDVHCMKAASWCRNMKNLKKYAASWGRGITNNTAYKNEYSESKYIPLLVR